MATIVLKGTPYDGSYELGEGFTMGELHTIKRVAGVRGAELEDAFASGDTDLIVAFYIIALQRAGATPDEKTLWDSQAGNITLDFGGDEEEDEVDPTVSAVTP